MTANFPKLYVAGPKLWNEVRVKQYQVWMRFLDWCGSAGIHVVAGIALVVLIATTIIGNGDLGFKIESDDRPIYYDLSMGILAAYFFNLMVITVPRHRHQRDLHLIVVHDLYIVASEAYELMRYLELIARCPERKFH